MRVTGELLSGSSAQYDPPVFFYKESSAVLFLSLPVCTGSRDVSRGVACQ